MSIKLYSAVFFKSGLHMTYDFNPEHAVLPDGITSGDRQSVLIKGVSILNSFGVLSCECENKRHDGVMKYQENGVTPLHITLYTHKKTEPKEAGTFLELNVAREPFMSPCRLFGKWGFMRANGKIDYTPSMEANFASTII
jgi:hypothetical protein